MSRLRRFASTAKPWLMIKLGSSPAALRKLYWDGRLNQFIGLPSQSFERKPLYQVLPARGWLSARSSCCDEQCTKTDSGSWVN